MYEIWNNLFTKIKKNVVWNPIISKLLSRLTCELAHAIDHIAADTAVLEEDDLNTDSTSWVARRMIEYVSALQETLREKRKAKEVDP